MKTRRIALATVCVAMALLPYTGSAALGAEPAEKPTLKVGDQWTFAQTIDATKETTWSRKIINMAPDGVMDVETAPDKTQQFDASWNFIDPRGAEYSRAPFRFPIRVGEAWSFTTKVGNSVMMDQRNEYKVVAYEPVTVPAGTFDCFRIEGKSQATYKSSYQYEMTETYWYCPKVNYVAKVQRETNVRSRDTGSSHEKTESLLTRYAPKG